MEHKSRTYGKLFHTWKGPFRVKKVFSDNAYGLVEVKTGNKLRAINGKYLKATITNKKKYELAIGHNTHC